MHIPEMDANLVKKHNFHQHLGFWKQNPKLVPLLSTPCGTTGKDYCYDGCHWITY